MSGGLVAAKWPHVFRITWFTAGVTSRIGASFKLKLNRSAINGGRYRKFTHDLKDISHK
jgi:hypothetical protein